MHNYYLNTSIQSLLNGGNCELHKEICPYCSPYKHNPSFVYIGSFFGDKEALIATKRIKPNIASLIDGCFYCYRSIHKQ